MPYVAFWGVCRKLTLSFGVKACEDDSFILSLLKQRSPFSGGRSSSFSLYKNMDMSMGWQDWTKMLLQSSLRLHASTLVVSYFSLSPNNIIYITFRLSLRVQFCSLSPVKCFLQPFILIYPCPLRTLSMDTLPCIPSGICDSFLRGVGGGSTRNRFKP